MVDYDKTHILVRRNPDPEKFTPRGGGGGKGFRRVANPASHINGLLRQYDSAVPKQTNDGDNGSRLTVKLYKEAVDALNNISSLESTAKGKPKLLAVKPIATGQQFEPLIQATILIPKGQRGYLLKKLSRYRESLNDTDGKNPRNYKLVESIQSLAAGTIKDLWTEEDSEYPTDEEAPFWWEVWLVDSSKATVKTFRRFVNAENLSTSESSIGFANRTVTLLKASPRQLAEAFDVIDIIAELRKPHTIAGFILREDPSEQHEWSEDLVSRTQWPSDNAPAVCILDGGVQREHPLLERALAPEDVLTTLPSSDPKPGYSEGHGTEMAGIALFGDLGRALEQATPLDLNHRLESVRVLPRAVQNDPQLYAAITAAATSQVETTNVGSDRQRSFMMAVTDTSSSSTQTAEAIGRPSSWSAAIDALSYGRSIKRAEGPENFEVFDRTSPLKPRLFIIAAGNIRDIEASDEPHDRSDNEPIENPAQAWNALTVGAYTNVDDMSNAPDGFEGYTPLVEKGDLSAISRTSVPFEKRRPIKPDVVGPGGNYAKSPTGDSIDTPDTLGVLTTSLYRAGSNIFTTSRDTSAATAYVASIAAEIQAQYPSMRPETVRALIVHSAQWTPQMLAQGKKINMMTLLRRYGMGVPSLERALHSATNAACLVSESVIHPFVKDPVKNELKMGEMNIHQLPWPTEILQSLGNTTVRLRTTLSYYIDPNPGSRGWNGRYSYPSFGLSSSMQRTYESHADFRKRLNKEALGEGEKFKAKDKDTYSLLPSDLEHAPGSVHSSIWEGPATNLSLTSEIAVYPTGGWWKYQPNLDQSPSGVHYSLVISIEAPESTVDFWTPIYNLNLNTITVQQLALPIEIDE